MVSLLGLTQPSELLNMAEAAESSGVFEHVWVGDSIMAKPRLEAMTLMGPSQPAPNKYVSALPAWPPSPPANPIVMAHQWASLDLISEGRMIMAACMGGSLDQQDHRIEYRNMGMKALDRSRRMEESMRFCDASGPRTRWTTMASSTIWRARSSSPSPFSSPPPIWIVSNPRLRTGKPTSSSAPSSASPE